MSGRSGCAELVKFRQQIFASAPSDLGKRRGPRSLIVCLLIACSHRRAGQRDRVQHVLNALERRRRRHCPRRVHTLGGSRSNGSEKVHVIQGAPHDLVMKEVSAVITQGGHGTVIRALANGVAAAHLPMHGDKAPNARAVEARARRAFDCASASKRKLSGRFNRWSRAAIQGRGPVVV